MVPFAAVMAAFSPSAATPSPVTAKRFTEAAPASCLSAFWRDRNRVVIMLPATGSCIRSTKRSISTAVPSGSGRAAASTTQRAMAS